MLAQGVETCWLVVDRLKHLQGDVVAGLTVALTLVPQSIAYAQIANLDSKVAIYGSSYT